MCGDVVGHDWDITSTRQWQIYRCRRCGRNLKVTARQQTERWVISFVNHNGSYAVAQVIASDVRSARRAFLQAHPDYREILSEEPRT